MDQVDITGELAKIRARGTEVSSTSLIKTDSLRIVLMALKAGAQLHEHHADGRLTVQVLDGQVEFHAEQEQRKLQAGALVTVEAMVPHGVIALSDAALLLTIAWHPQAPGNAGAHRGIGYQ
ncbi:MAG TPA: cupin domain-containing protein [Acidobacteriaceae bacterium]|nr:cupin domain-containing protein [Acidobacteriaceae bacterium]